MTVLALNKGIAVVMAIAFMFCLTPINKSHNVSAEISGYHENKFYGALDIDGKKLPMIVMVEDTTTNKNENKKNENTKITDDKTPGKIKIIIENGDKKATLERDIGSGVMSDIDREIYKQVSDSLTEFVSKNKTVGEKVTGIVKGFADYCQKDRTQRKWFKWI